MVGRATKGEDERLHYAEDCGKVNGEEDQLKRFPYPWEVDAPEGAEGWERMYPEYLLFREENAQRDGEAFWVHNAMHNPRAVYPFDTICIEGIQLAAGQNNTRTFAVPAAFGMQERILNGYRYLSPVELRDPEQVGLRAPIFKERASFYYSNWDRIYTEWRSKVEANIEAAEALEFARLPDLEPAEVVEAARGTSSGFQLLHAFGELIERFFLMWQYHFEMANIAHAALGTFNRFCRQSVPGTSDQTVARMLAGRELLVYRPDEELKRLARRAAELDLREAIEVAAKAGDLSGLGQSEAGRRWLEDFEAVKDPWFYYSEGGNFYHDEPSWIDDLALPLRGIVGYIERLEAGEDLDRPLEQLRSEAAEIVGQHRAQLDPALVGQFDELLALAEKVFPFTQDHSWYGLNWFLTIFWQQMRKLGDAMVGLGAFVEADDLFFLQRHELSSVLWDAVVAWAIGTEAVGATHWHGEVEQRRKIFDALQATRALPALGTPPEQISNPLLISHVGITTAVVNRWLGEGDDDVLSGVGASPGTVEATCRVVDSVDHIGELKEGEVLVCKTTAPSWGPVFSRIAGMVTDTGGMLSHSAVVAREYGFPAVVGCTFATETLKTGMRVRLDGDQGTVVVLDEAEPTTLPGTATRAKSER
jgi:pyruvate, water dikinase